MSERDLSHRQKQEQEKKEHAHSTRGRYFSSRHLTWTVVVGVILIGAAVLVWTFLLPAMLGPG